MLSEKNRKVQEAYDQAHENSDVDNEPSSIHHTLGPGNTQAAPGNHKHSDDIFVGEIIMSGGTAAPNANFLPADGQVVLRADYPACFAYYGTTHNTGGETALQFRLPNLNDRFPLGRSGTRPVGSQGGEETHTLTQSEIPDHNHSIRGGLNATASNTGDSFGRSNTQPGDGNFRSGGMNNGAGYGSPAVAGGQPHNNMPPYVGILFLVRMKIG